MKKPGTRLSGGGKKEQPWMSWKRLKKKFTKARGALRNEDKVIFWYEIFLMLQALFRENLKKEDNNDHKNKLII